MPPYYHHPYPHGNPQHPHYNYYNKHHGGHVKWPEKNPVTNGEIVEATTGYTENKITTTFNDIIKNVQDIINQQLTTQATIDTNTDQDVNPNINETFNQTINIQPTSVIDDVTEALTPIVTEETFEDIATPTYPYIFEETTGMIETTTQNVYEGATNYITTAKSHFVNDQGPNFDHDHYHPSLDDDHPYLILIIILSILVIVASVVLYLYIRHKRLNRQNECSPISIVGKKFQPHNIFSGEKPNVDSQIKKGSSKSEKMQVKEPVATQRSSLKDTNLNKPTKMESVEFEESPNEYQQQINPR